MRCLAVFFIGLATLSFVNLLCLSIWASCHQIRVVGSSTYFNQTADGSSPNARTRQKLVAGSLTSDQTRRLIVASSSTAKQTHQPTVANFSASAHSPVKTVSNSSTFNLTRQWTISGSSVSNQETHQKTVAGSSMSNQTIQKTAYSSSTANQTRPPTHQITVARQSVFSATRHYKSLKNDGPFTMSCSSCAVVSSSGTLLGQGAGKEIDSHSCVIRMNMAPVEGYQNDVGTRTSLRVMNFFMFQATPDKLPPNSQVMVWGLLPRKSNLEKAKQLVWRLRAGSNIYGQTMQGEIEADQLFAKETGRHRDKTNSWLSTGWFTMMIALEICQKTHVYGMVPSYYCTMNGTADVPYHYYDSPEIKQCATYKEAETNSKGAHRYMTEKAVFARWAVKYNISFHHPEWAIDRENLTNSLDTPFLRRFSSQN